MIELNILYLFINNKDIYNKYNKYINIDYIKENNKEIYKIFKLIEIYYTKYINKESITKEDLELSYLNNYPILKASEREALLILLDRIYSINLDSSSEELVTNYLSKQKIQSLSHKLTGVCLAVYEGKKNPDEILLLSSELKNLLDSSSLESNEENSFVEGDLNKLYEETVHTPGLRWRLETLNQSLGSLRKGDFGFIFARPETGKTTFLASEITKFAEQTNRPILWFNNEEQGSKVMIRCYQASLGLTLPQLYSDVQGNNQKFKELTKGNIRIFDNGSIYRKTVERLCNELNPSLIIFDQIDKIKGFTEDRYDLVMKDIYQWARELAKRYGPVIGVCQAGGTGESKRWLTMDDVDSSKTAKQGEADWILGIGKIQDEGYESTRFFHLSKNKLSGDEDTLPEKRHMKESVYILPEIGQYKDMD